MHTSTHNTGTHDTGTHDTGTHDTMNIEATSSSLIVNRYKVARKLGAGSMGSVFQCTDTLLANDQIALKTLFRDLTIDATYIARFQREVLLARKLGHPNIVRVFDYGVTDDLEHFLTMELLTGGSLREKMDKSSISVEQSIEYITAIASAVQYAHTHDVVHRDLKPDNILFGADGTLKVSDFGTARGADASVQNLTQTGDSMGTPIYMAPEIVQGARGTKSSDLYSIGIMAYELIMGEPPFLALNWVSLAAMHVSKPAPLIPELKAPEWYRQMVARLLEKDPSSRFATAKDLYDFIVESRRERPMEPATPWTPLILSAGIGAVAGAALTFLLR